MENFYKKLTFKFILKKHKWSQPLLYSEYILFKIYYFWKKKKWFGLRCFGFMDTGVKGVYQIYEWNYDILVTNKKCTNIQKVEWILLFTNSIR